MGCTPHKAKQPLLGMNLQSERKRIRKIQVIGKYARFLFTLALKKFRLLVKGKQSAGTEFHSIAVVDFRVLLQIY